MPSGWEATGEVRWSSRWAASTRCVNLLLAKNPPCRGLRHEKQPASVGSDRILTAAYLRGSPTALLSRD